MYHASRDIGLLIHNNVIFHFHYDSQDNWQQPQQLLRSPLPRKQIVRIVVGGGRKHHYFHSRTAFFYYWLYDQQSDCCDAFCSIIVPLWHTLQLHLRPMFTSFDGATWPLSLPWFMGKPFLEIVEIRFTVLSVILVLFCDNFSSPPRFIVGFFFLYLFYHLVDQEWTYDYFLIYLGYYINAGELGGWCVELIPVLFVVCFIPFYSSKASSWRNTTPLALFRAQSTSIVILLLLFVLPSSLRFIRCSSNWSISTSIILLWEGDGFLLSFLFHVTLLICHMKLIV